jgi:hypothetical protein
MRQDSNNSNITLHFRIPDSLVSNSNNKDHTNSKVSPTTNKDNVMGPEDDLGTTTIPKATSHEAETQVLTPMVPQES